MAEAFDAAHRGEDADVPVDDLGETGAEKEFGNVAVGMEAGWVSAAFRPALRGTHAVPIMMLLVTVCGAGRPLEEAAPAPAEGGAPSDTGADSS